MLQPDLNRDLSLPLLPKCPTGIQGLDEITLGGLPQGRPTLICGSAGCGKTLMGIEFLVRGAMEYGEPGVLIAFEENEEELTKNVASLGYDLKDLIAKKKLIIDYVHIERSEIEEAGEYDLEGLFIPIGINQKCRLTRLRSEGSDREEKAHHRLRSYRAQRDRRGRRVRFGGTVHPDRN